MRLQRRLHGICLVRFLHSGFLVGQNWHISVLDHLAYDQTTQLNAVTKNKASNRHVFKILGRLYSLIRCR